MPSDLSLVSARMKAICSRREYAEKDIVEKLLRRGLSSAEVAVVMKELVSENFVDDGRYAGCFVRDKMQLAGWGRKKIEFALRRKGVASKDIVAAFETVDEGVADKRMMEVLENKRKQLRNEKDLRKLKEKLLRFALSRGYGYEQVRNVVQDLIRTEIDK